MYKRKRNLYQGIGWSILLIFYADVLAVFVLYMSHKS